FYTYSNNGNLNQITYPHGRVVNYVYGSSDGRNDRVSDVQIKTLSGTGWSSLTTLLTAVTWEPYGGLRGYVVNHLLSSNTSTVEYMLGGDGTSALGCSAKPPSGGDFTGRLRSLRVTKGTQSAGTEYGDIYQRAYTWRADQIVRMNTC